MPDSATIIHDGKTSHRLQITHRDWMLICGPGFVEGAAFIDAFGIFENYTMAGGIPREPLVRRDGKTLFDATTVLLRAIQRDYDLMKYDYAYKIGDKPKRYGGGQSISVDGRHGVLSLRPKGYCSIKLVDAKTEQHLWPVIDLRNKENFITDSGPLKLFRRKAKIFWLDILPPLLEFLSSRLTTELSIEHIDRVA